MSLFLANIIGWVIANWRLMAIVAAVVGFLILFGFVMQSCEKKPVFDEQKIEQAKQAIAEKDRQAMVEILAQSELAEKKINANLANAETEKLNTLEATRIRTSSMSNDELAQELERRLNK